MMDIFELIQNPVSELEIDELKSLLQHYENHEEKYKYEMKIRQIQRMIRMKEKPKSEPEWIKYAREDRDTKEKWLELGAYWNRRGTFTTWYYKGDPFYKWFGGLGRNHISKEILNVREADKRLDRMVKERGDGS